MNHREKARKYFKKCNLDYNLIDIDYLYDLIRITNKKIAETDTCCVMMCQPTRKQTKFKNKNSMRDLIYAELRVKGTYFDDREAYTFNEDGFIGFCGWADGRNCLIFTEAFMEWCDYLKDKVGVNR